MIIQHWNCHFWHKRNGKKTAIVFNRSHHSSHLYSKETKQKLYDSELFLLHLKQNQKNRLFDKSKQLLIAAGASGSPHIHQPSYPWLFFQVFHGGCSGRLDGLPSFSCCSVGFLNTIISVQRPWTRRERFAFFEHFWTGWRRNSNLRNGKSTSKIPDPDRVFFCVISRTRCNSWSEVRNRHLRFLLAVNGSKGEIR